jgi:hypothetical protein
MSNAPSDAYLRHVQRLLLQGKPATLPFPPEDEPESKVVVSLAAARTRKCIAALRRRGEL